MFCKYHNLIVLVSTPLQPPSKKNKIYIYIYSDMQKYIYLLKLWTFCHVRTTNLNLFCLNFFYVKGQRKDAHNCYMIWIWSKKNNLKVRWEVFSPPESILCGSPDFMFRVLKVNLLLDGEPAVHRKSFACWISCSILVSSDQSIIFHMFTVSPSWLLRNWFPFYNSTLLATLPLRSDWCSAQPIAVQWTHPSPWAVYLCSSSSRGPQPFLTWEWYEGQPVCYALLK